MRLLAAAAALLLLASCQSVDGPTVAVTGSAAVEAIPDIEIPNRMAIADLTQLG